jgi:hypothetical protein
MSCQVFDYSASVPCPTDGCDGEVVCYIVGERQFFDAREGVGHPGWSNFRATDCETCKRKAWTQDERETMRGDMPDPPSEREQMYRDGCFD